MPTDFNDHTNDGAQRLGEACRGILGPRSRVSKRIGGSSAPRTTARVRMPRGRVPSSPCALARGWTRRAIGLSARRNPGKPRNRRGPAVIRLPLGSVPISADNPAGGPLRSNSASPTPDRQTSPTPARLSSSLAPRVPRSVRSMASLPRSIPHTATGGIPTRSKTRAMPIPMTLSPSDPAATPTTPSTA